MLAVIADSYVDMNFGTGALKVTPAHDLNDYHLGVKHQLPTLTIMNKDGTMNEKVINKKLIGLNWVSAGNTLVWTGSSADSDYGVI